MKYIHSYKKFIWTTLITSILAINLAAYLGAYSLTNYPQESKNALGYSRPKNNKTPTELGLAYTTNRLDVNQQEWIETWLIKPSNNEPKGTLILFHGKNATKSSLLAPAAVFHRLGYTTLLVDFRGGGGSSGNTTTIGVKESQDVAVVMNYMREKYPDRPIILYGVSLGTSAILRAISKDKIKPDRIILELPFTSLLSAVKKRLERANIPTFPLGELMVFWGGVQHGFNGFAHQPIDYAKRVDCPTLILHGTLDNTVDFSEVKLLYQNIKSSKKLIEFSQAGHQLLVTIDRQLWQQSVRDFLF